VLPGQVTAPNSATWPYAKTLCAIVGYRLQTISVDNGIAFKNFSFRGLLSSTKSCHNLVLFCLLYHDNKILNVCSTNNVFYSLYFALQASVLHVQMASSYTRTLAHINKKTTE